MNAVTFSKELDYSWAGVSAITSYPGIDWQE
jgi:hypothetical protein